MNPDLLLIYDSAPEPRQLDILLGQGTESVCLFPITADESATRSLRGHLEQRHISVTVALTGELMAKAGPQARRSYIDLVKVLPDRVRPENGGLKALFPMGTAHSHWWLTLVADKNPMKSRTLNQLCHLLAVDDWIQAYPPRRMGLLVEDGPLALCLCDMARLRGIEALVPAERGDEPRFPSTREWLKGLREAARLLHGMFEPMKNELRASRPDLRQGELVGVTYYPNYDPDQARKGRYRNGYFPTLQTAIEETGTHLQWLCMHCPCNEHPHQEAVDLAVLLRRNGYGLHFLNDFYDRLALARALRAMLRIGRTFLEIAPELQGATRIRGICVYPLFHQDFIRSFLGAEGLYNQLVFRLFRSAMRTLKPSTIFYLCEMHSLEKALVMARDQGSPDTRLIGYQYGTVSPMHSNYLFSPGEIGQGHSQLPVPDLLLANGEEPLERLARWGWPRAMLGLAEALRYDDVTECYDHQPETKQDILLVLLSISAQESIAILGLVKELRSLDPSLPVWLKPHPFLLLDQLDGQMGALSCEVKTGRVGPLLSRAKAVLVGESSTALHALASGCHVFKPATPQWMDLSPLSSENVPGVRSVADGASLLEAARAAFSGEAGPVLPADRRREIVGRILELCQQKTPIRFLHNLFSTKGCKADNSRVAFAGPASQICLSTENT